MRLHPLRRTAPLALVLAGLAVAGCGGKNTNTQADAGHCDVATNAGCPVGKVCEEVQNNGTPVCAAPLVMKGRVFNLADQSGVSGAHVVALDVNGSATSSVAVSADGGGYELAIPSLRDTAGKPVGADVTLRVDAAGFQSFPEGVRQALPISTASPADGGSELVVQSAQTDVGLIALPSSSGLGSISGTAQVPADRAGILVVAESGGAGKSAIADKKGAYTLFNVPAGAWTVNGYARGSNYTPASATVTAGQVATANLNLDASKPAAKVSGSVQIVNPGSGNATSVVLVVESTFDANQVRGETPPGLRAPSPGTAPNVTGAFSIDGVPEGKYVVLAGFENDNLVRDPDPSIAGTQIVHITVSGSGEVAIPTSFKVTGALDVIGPGKDAPEAVQSKPTLSWVDDSSEDGYHVYVFDAFGQQVWTTDLPKVTGGNVSVAYQGPLDRGMFYQFKAVSFRNTVNGEAPISNTEDLRGVFYMP